MIPNVDESVLTSEFSLKTAPSPKPEAPWIKRCDYGIKFTDEIQVLDQPMSSTITDTENEDVSKVGKSKQERHDDSSNQDDDFDRQDEQESKSSQSQLNERYYLRSYVK